MPIPNVKQAMSDVVEVLGEAGGQATSKEIDRRLVEKWRLTNEEMEIPDSYSGRLYRKQMYRAINILKRQQQRIYSPQRGVWRLKVVPPPPPPPPPPDGPDRLAEQIKNLVEKLAELAKKEKEKPLPSHDELVQKVKEIGETIGKIAEVGWGPVYKHDCVWKDNPYANPRIVVEVCHKGLLDKDLASLPWAVKNWAATGILVVVEESDFYAAQKKLAPGSQVYPIKAGDMLKLYSLLQTGNIQAIRSIFYI